MHPFYLIVMLLMIALILGLPKKYVIVPFTIGIFLVPIDQQVYAIGVHWLSNRIITLAGLVRVVLLSSTKDTPFAGGLTSIDRVFAGYILCESAAFVLLYHNGGAVINQFGFLIDCLVTYVLVRAMINNEEAINRTLNCLAGLTVILAAAMVYEQIARQNMFGILGGAHIIPEIREGKVRSQAAFQHSLTAGVVGAALLPLFLALWSSGKSRYMAVAGVAGSTIMTICSQSSTPLLAWVAGVAGICLWPLRAHMRTLRRGLVVAILVLHLIMKAPVWFLIARIDLTGSSSGYHRAEVVDQFIGHFSDWWMIGTSNAGNWGWDLWDTQNEFVHVGETGGLLALVLFIVLIKRSYTRIGASLKSAANRKAEWRIWLLGTAMFSNLVAFFGVNYFDQSRVGWFILLAIIVTATKVKTSSCVEVTRKESAGWWGQSGESEHAVSLDVAATDVLV
jgi:hypothetical protein